VIINYFCQPEKIDWIEAQSKNVKEVSLGSYLMLELE